MRTGWIYSIVAALGVVLPCGAAAATAPVAVAMCEAAATSAGSLRLGEEASAIVPTDESDLHLDEALRAVAGRATRWLDAPALIVLRSVMDYQSGARTEYQATSDRLSDDEVNALVADLTMALAVLTGNTFARFADVRIETVSAGAMVSVMRPGQIVVGRYRGVRDRLKTIGVGGRLRSGGAIKAGTVVLDADYDSTSSKRVLLRTHELGHALGYDHVESRPSIMNPRIGAEITEYDRRAALVAFHEGPAPSQSCPSL